MQLPNGQFSFFIKDVKSIEVDRHVNWLAWTSLAA